MKLSKELKAGLIVTAGIALFILGFSYLKANPIFQSSRTYYAVYDDVEGLVPSTKVTINGLPIGKVQSIGFKDQSGKLLVTFMVDSDFQFSKNSKAQIYEPGLIGGKALAIIPAFDGQPSAVSGDTLASSRKAGLSELVNQKLTPIGEKIEGMITSADSVLTNINSLLDEKTKNDLKESLTALNKTINSFNNTSSSLNELVSNNKGKLDSTIGNFDKAAAGLAVMSEDLAKADLGKTMAELKTTVTKFNKVLSSIENGEGTMGKLLKDKELYNNLSGASKQLEALLEDMKLNPKRYVHFSLFGKKPKEYTTPKDSLQ